MTPELFLTSVLVPSLTWLSSVVGPIPPNSREARLMLLAIPGVESDYENVAQEGGGPGRGFYQDEPETCGEVLNNPASTTMMHKVCAVLDIPATEAAIYGALLGSPRLQVALSRLDLFCDPSPLPAYGDEMGGWSTYLRVWRPGKPSLQRWSGVYLAALAADQAWEKAQGV